MLIKEFENRATVRKFDKSRHIPEELLEELLQAASHAPTTGNMQLYSVIITRDPEEKKRLAPLHFNQPTVEGCDVLLTFCADFRRFEAWCEARKAEPGYRNFHSFITALIDTTIFAQQFVTLAELNGIGSCYLGTATYSAEAIGEALGVPERVVPVICLAVGYPESGFPAASDRLPVEGIIHHEHYKDYTPEDIDRIFGPKEALPENRNFVEINQKETLAQIFTDIRYPRGLNEQISEAFARYIEKQGF